VTARFGYSVVASSLHDPDAVDALTAPVRAALDDLGGSLDAGHQADVHLFVVATGGTEGRLLDVIAERRSRQPGVPVVLVSHGAHNSLPASLEALAAIKQRGDRGRIVSLAGNVVADRRALDEAVGDLEAIAKMATMTRTPVTPTGALAERFTQVADPARTTVERQAVDDAMGVRSALLDVVDDSVLDAVTVRCFDLLGDPGTSGCLALASLNDDGIVAGCEGDVPSALAMLWVRALFDQPAWMANPATIDAAANELVLAHCTVAPSMVEGFALDTHFESGMGVGISGRFAHQPVTLIRLGGADLDECWIAEGDITATGDDADLCRTQVTVALSSGHVGDLLEHPLGNHLVLVQGHHEQRLRSWWRLVVAD